MPKILSCLWFGALIWGYEKIPAVEGATPVLNCPKAHVALVFKFAVSTTQPAPKSRELKDNGPSLKVVKPPKSLFCICLPFYMYHCVSGDSCYHMYLPLVLLVRPKSPFLHKTTFSSLCCLRRS